MNKYYRWFRRVLLLAVIIDAILGALAIFFPNTTLRLFGLSPSQDVYWTAFGGMAILMIALLMCPATRDPLRYQLTAKYSIITKFSFALFFLVLWPGRYLLFGIMDLVFFVLLFVLWWLARREPQPEWQPASAS